MADIQQQTEGHRFRAMVQPKSPKQVWFWGTENSYKISQKAFQDLLQRHRKILLKRMPMNTKPTHFIHNSL